MLYFFFILEPPYFISLLNDTQIVAGQTLNLYCHVTGPGGALNVEWYHNDVRLSESDEVILSEGNKTLILYGIGYMWTGNFTCSAHNQYGISSSVAHVQVHGKEEENRERERGKEGYRGMFVDVQRVVCTEV